jgi:hypothetical protein
MHLPALYCEKFEQFSIKINHLTIKTIKLNSVKLHNIFHWKFQNIFWRSTSGDSSAHSDSTVTDFATFRGISTPANTVRHPTPFFD